MLLYAGRVLCAVVLNLITMPRKSMRAMWYAVDFACNAMLSIVVEF